MTIDVIDLRDFDPQRLGIVARQLINRGIGTSARRGGAARARCWSPDADLGPFRDDSERCIAFMPAAQGVLKWPTARPALATLIDEFHAAAGRRGGPHFFGPCAGTSDDPERLLREVWRVLVLSGV